MPLNAPIGVFDSGLGGLSVLAELVRALPQEQFIYVADSAHCPYGEKSSAAIISRARSITEFLLGQGAKLIVVACNTATIAAIETLREEFPLHFVGMEPAVKPAVAATRSGTIGVLATGAALKGEKLHKLIATHAGAVRVLTQPCPGWVEQVEAGALATPQTLALVQQYLSPLLAEGADVLVLGCTHYPFLRPLIQQLAGPAVTLLDTGVAVARRTRNLLEADGLLASSGSPSVTAYTSGDPALSSKHATPLWPTPLHWQPL